MQKTGFLSVDEHRPFLVGAPRSGTTVFRLLLDNHPQIAWHHFGFEYAVELVQASGNPPNAAAYQEYLATHRVYQNHGYEVSVDDSYAQIVDGFLRQVASNGNKQFSSINAHHNFDRLAHLWPNGRFVYVVRYPRGVAA